MEEKETCKNCEFFVQHYAKHGSSITTVCCGHCSNPKLTMPQKKKRFNEGLCELWMPDKEKRVAQQQSLEKVLYDISQQLSVIAALLKKDQQ